MGRIVVSIQQKKERQAQQQLLRDLSNQQMRQNAEISKKQTEEAIQRSINSINLDSMQQALDSIGQELRKNQEEFERKMNQTK